MLINSTYHKRIIVFVNSMVFSIAIQCQTIVLSGNVSDQKTGEILIGANIVDIQSGKGAITNNYGFYSLELPVRDSLRIWVSHVGYGSIIETALIVISTRKNFSLVPGILLDSILVSAFRETPIELRAEMSMLRIPTQQISKLPSIGGESDILKVIQLMPGVRSGNEGSSDFYVRGGSPDQNLMLLDGVPLYYVNHLGGFVSTFNSDAINSVKIIKGGFPARYGSRLSSVMDVRMKDGNYKEFSGTGTIGMVNSKVMAEGPLKADTSSYMISFRRFMYDIISRPLSKLVFDGIELGYYFYDFNSKLNYRIDKNNTIYLSLYLGDDASLIRLKEKKDSQDEIIKTSVKWGNQLAALRWNHIFSPKLFSNLTFTYTKYRHSLQQHQSLEMENLKRKLYNSFESGIYDFSAFMNVELYATPFYTMRFGIKTTNHNFSPGITTFSQTSASVRSDTMFGNYRINAWQHAVYVENELKLGSRVNSNLGGRISTYSLDKINYTSFEPRLLISYLVGKNLSAKGSWARMQQNVHLLTSGGVGIPVDLWVPATALAKPSISDQWALGLAKSLNNNSIEMSIEIYYKEMSNLIAYKEGAEYGGAGLDWQQKIETDGKGLAYGAEFLLHKKQGRTNGWIAYTWSRTTREFSNLNFGNPFLFKYDRTHDFSFVSIYKLTEKISFSGTWVYATGNAFTLAQGRYFLSNEKPHLPTEIHIYDGINTLRMRSYHKLDVGFDYEWFRKERKRKLNFSIYNLYNRQNPYFYYFENQVYYDPDQPNKRKERTILKQQSFFPIIPSVSYSFSF